MITLETQFLIQSLLPLLPSVQILFCSFCGTGVHSAAVGRHARRRTCRMITLETQFLIRLCFLCYLLFKSSSAFFCTRSCRTLFWFFVKPGS